MSLEQKYKTGVLWQDIQHQQLIDLLESFSEAETAGQDKYTYTLAFLVMYVNHHFGLEEAYMEAYAYPGLAAHKVEHAAYIQQLKEFLFIFLCQFFCCEFFLIFKIWNNHFFDHRVFR